ENILMDINDILEVYNLLKYNIMPKNKYITINYNKKSILLLVKLGSNVFNVLKHLEIDTNSKIMIYGNSILEVSEKVIITKDVRYIEVL
ncbi:MAG: hypothetical protein RSD96_03035, partial [Bacilli bacterium]